MISTAMWRSIPLLLGGLTLINAQRLRCPSGINGVGFQMVESNIARGQGLEVNSAGTGLIEVGLFQQALHESIASTQDSGQKDRWQAALESSINSANITLANSTRDNELPLDRFSLGSSLLRWYNETRNPTYLPTIQALQWSVINQKVNQNGGIWYWANPLNMTAYQNLSYLDGMYSYAPFVISSLHFDYPSYTVYFNEAEAWKQLSLLRTITKVDSGLMVHGYDPTFNHSWANPPKGASPVVWGRSQALYTLGVVNSIEVLETQYSDLIYNFKDLYLDLVKAQLRASDRSRSAEGQYGVWQVVDRPGGKGNFVEASASLMTVYSLLRGARLNWIENKSLKSKVQNAAVGIYEAIVKEYLTDGGDGILNLNGTSSIAILSGDVDYAYYVGRPTVPNSLIGTSAFILAALEVEKLCEPTA